MYNLNNNGVQKVMFWRQQCNGADVRRIFWTTGEAQEQVWRIFLHLGFYPHDLQSTQRLLRRDHTNHVRFCEGLKPWLQILPDNLFTDEALCTWDGITNTRNSHN
jgi:hypothetical protein